LVFTLHIKKAIATKNFRAKIKYAAVPAEDWNLNQICIRRPLNATTLT